MLDRRVILAVCGTRPEAVKLVPVVEALRRVGRPVHLVATGQHPDLAPMMLREAGMQAEHDLGIGGAGMATPHLLAGMVPALVALCEAAAPPLVLVQGDTVSALAGALAASYAGLPVAHVEAGLRTGDVAEPFPEETHRRLVGQLATLHFAPTRRAAAALLREGIDAASIHVTGNSGIDAFHRTLARVAGDAALDAEMALRFPLAMRGGAPLVLATVHRRENLGERLRRIAEAIARLAGSGGARVIMPLHPNPQVRQVLRKRLGALPEVMLAPAQCHRSMAWLMQRADLLLTDSGGLQEEAPSVGLRTIVLRRATERQEAVEAGISELVELEAGAIHAAALRALAMPRPAPAQPFGDGNAAVRIAAIIDDWLDRREVAPAGVALAG